MSETIEENKGIPQVELSTERDVLLVQFRIMQLVPRKTTERLIDYSQDMTFPRGDYQVLLSEYARLHMSIQKLKTLKDQGLIDEPTMMETLKQQAFLEDNRDKIALNRGYVVASGEKLFFGETYDEAIKKARAAVGERPFFSESIGLIDFPSPFDEGN